MTKYLENIKSLSDSLTTTAHPIKETNLVFYTRGCLGPDFKPFVMSITSRKDIITITNLHPLLLTQEHHLALPYQLSSLEISSIAMANVASWTIDKPFLFNNANVLVVVPLTVVKVKAMFVEVTMTFSSCPMSFVVFIH